MGVIKLTGLVLNEMKKGEADKLLTLFTLEQGKVYVHAKGARKLKSKYFSGTGQFDFSEFVVFMGRDFYSVTQVDKLEGFKGISSDYNKLCYSNYFLEMVDKTTYQGEANPDTLRLLISALKTLERGVIENSCICRAFELKYMQAYGYSPIVDACSACGALRENDGELFFGTEGFLCPDCAVSNPFASKINGAAFSAINYILSSDIKTVFSFKLDNNSMRLLKRATDIFMLNLDISLNAKKFIDDFEN